MSSAQVRNAMGERNYWELVIQVSGAQTREALIDQIEQKVRIALEDLPAKRPQAIRVRIDTRPAIADFAHE